MFPILSKITLPTLISSYHLNGFHSDLIKSTRYFDLSYSFSNDTVYFPGQKHFELHKDKEKVMGERYTRIRRTRFISDDPFDFNPDEWTVDQIPTSNLIDVPATLIDVSRAVNDLKRPNEFVVEVKHIIQHETESNYRIIRFGGVLLIYTGWSKFWPNKVKYLGWDDYHWRKDYECETGGIESSKDMNYS